jgi:hypothetical protein
MIIVSEDEFVKNLKLKLKGVSVKSVTGPGRSGAVASVFSSHILRIPFIPYGQTCPDNLRPLLVVDTAKQSGVTLRKAQKKYGPNSVVINIYDEPPRVKFWYEFLGEQYESSNSQ